jgi:hypothetical protein
MERKIILDKKTMYYGNFNITFGKNEEPMLSHFVDAIYPAFKSKIIRGNKDEGKPEYSFSNVMLKEYSNDKIALVGNCIKDTQYEVLTTKQEDGTLKEDPCQIPTAPYSRFIIFLNNHRMVLIKNESQSPDIRSFQLTVTQILHKYRQQHNRSLSKESKSRIPYAIVNIVDMKLKDDIEHAIKDISSIKRFNLRFFPLNGDIDTVPITSAIRSRMKELQSNTANLKFNSPKSKQGVANLVEETSVNGLAKFTISGKDQYGQPIDIKEDTFKSSQDVIYRGNISESDDSHFIEVANKNPIISKIGKVNEIIYDKYKKAIKNLF